MHQYLGLFLLILAISAGLYIAANKQDILNFRIPLSFNIQPISVPYGGANRPINSNNGATFSIPAPETMVIHHCT